MKRLLIVSLVLSIIASLLVFSHPQQANAVPVSYNVTSLSVPFTSYTRAGANNFDFAMESGFNGTVNSVYQVRTTNNTFNWEFGYHPTLPMTIDTVANITASASVSATHTIPITIASGHNNVFLLVAITFDHTADINHNNARMSSVTIGGFPMLPIQNRTVTCGASACDIETWGLGNNTALTGAQTVTITPASSANHHIVAGAYSLYNVRAVKPIGAGGSSTGTSIKPTVNVTPTFTSAWIIDNLLSLQTTSPGANATQKFIGKTSVLMGASQVLTTPTIGAANSLTYSTTNVQWISDGIEIIPIQNQKNFGYNPAWPIYSGLASGNIFTNNGSSIYYLGNFGPANIILNHLDTSTGVEIHDYTIQNTGAGTACSSGASNGVAIFVTQKYINTYCINGATQLKINTVGGNSSVALGASISFQSNMKIKTATAGDKFSSNGTTAIDPTSITTNQCELTYIPSNTTTPIDNIACDATIPDHVKRFWNGMYHYKNGNYYTNSTLSFLTTVDSNAYKKQLTIPASIYNIPNPDVKIIGHWNGADYLLSVSSGQINYVTMSYLTTLLSQNRAFQSYDLTLPLTDNHFFLAPSSINPSQNIKLYGLNGATLNITVAKYGMIGLPSGYTMRTTSTAESVIRTIDPRWTNAPSQDYPAITTTSSLFPIILTVANAPVDGALWLANSAQVINNVNSAWCITQLDTTHTAECDVPPNQCANVYVADISVTPTIFNYEGNVCATGTNQKSIAFTNTLPLTFYSMTTGATSSFTPSTNGLSTTVRSTTFPFTYNVIIKNSTGAITRNFTSTINGTIDTHVFNVTNTTKPGSVYISVTGKGQIYTSYLGSAVSLASVASFFHQYFSYQGFDLLSFIPLVFAGMFTRNTVGVGAAMTVVLIASLSWLSIVVIPDTTIFIMVVIAAIGMIGYRSFAG